MAEETLPVPAEAEKMEEAAAPSTSSEPSTSAEQITGGEDVDNEAKKLMGAGRRHMVMKDVRSAVNAFQEASSLLGKKYGETADQCADAFFSYGMALLELARMENGVLGNALEGMPEDEEEDGEKEEDPNIPSAANLDEKEREQLREQVYDAMAEQEKPEKADAEESKADAKVENGDIHMEEDKPSEETSTEEKTNGETRVADSEKSEDAEKTDAAGTEEKAAAQTENTGESKDEKSTGESVDEKSTSESKDEKSTSESKDEKSVDEKSTSESKDEKSKDESQGEKMDESEGEAKSTDESKDAKGEPDSIAEVKSTDESKGGEKMDESKSEESKAESTDEKSMDEAKGETSTVASEGEKSKGDSEGEKSKGESKSEEPEAAEKTEDSSKPSAQEADSSKTPQAVSEPPSQESEEAKPPSEETKPAKTPAEETASKEQPDEQDTKAEEEAEPMEGEEDGDGAESEDGEDNEETEEKENDEEDVDNLQLAWEMLDLSKVIFQRQKNKETQLKAAQAHLKLGEVSIESENYGQAVEDFLACLNIQKEHLEEHDRLLAETHYQLGLAYQYSSKHDSAISHFTQSTDVIEKRVAVLTEQLEKAAGESNKELQKEMDELKGLLPDIKEKIEDSKEAQKTAAATEKALAETLIPGSTGFTQENGSSSSASVAPAEKSGDSTVPVTNCVSDITYLVRKKRKTADESPLKEAKKAKAEPVENGSENGAGNGDAVVPTNEEVEKTEEVS
ncbi:nuclear autoantigenic sperm protein isoform 1-T1 [Mantella aurantiaca]